MNKETDITLLYSPFNWGLS